MKFSILFILYAVLLPYIGNAQSLIINRHSVAQFDSIPEAYKIAAAQQRMMFMDRSVGWNISSFLDCLSEPWSEAPSYCKRHQHMDSTYAVDPSEVYWNGAWDRSNWYFRFWPDGCSEDVTCFIDFVDDRLDSFDIMGCQFSYLAVNAGSNIADTSTGFFGDQGNDNKASTYAAFATGHPDKKLIWWTSSLARGIGTIESASFNDQMRAYAAVNDIILFDVADILSHNPDGNPCYDNRDGITYKDEAHPDDGADIPAICPQYTTETEGGHLGSISAGGVRVAKAFWVLMARTAGWQAAPAATNEIEKNHFTLFPNPASTSVQLLPENITPGVKVEIELFDMLGRKHFRNIFENSIAIKIPLADIDAGMYYMKIKAGKSLQSRILIVTK